MVILNVFLLGLAWLLCFIASSERKGFNMDCDCGKRMRTGDEENCEESAKLEAPEAEDTSII